MGVVKKSVAFDEKVVREAVEIAGERGFSRFVNDIVAQRLQALRLDALFAQMEHEFGPIPAEVGQAVAAELDALLCEPPQNPA